MANTTHCVMCGALIEKKLSIDGLGVRCGCLKKKYIELKKAQADKQTRLFV